MGYTTPMELDWDAPEGFGFSDELEFSQPGASTTPAQQRELEEFLRDFQDSEPVWEVLEMHGVGQFETEN